jgi:hypothetical protein
MSATDHGSANGEAPNGSLTTAAGAPVVDNNNVITAGPRGPMLMQDVWYQEKLAHFDRELIPKRRMHAKGSGAYGTFTVTNDITRYTRAKIFSEVGKPTEMFVRFSVVAGERGAGGGRTRPSSGRCQPSDLNIDRPQHRARPMSQRCAAGLRPASTGPHRRLLYSGSLR